MDYRDRLIRALAAQLRAERETREAAVEAHRAGVGIDVLEAILDDPVPATSDYPIADQQLRRLAHGDLLEAA